MLTPSPIRKVAVIGYNRIPFARQNTFYTQAGNKEMMSAALNGLVEKYHLQGIRMGEVAGGAVIKHSRDFNLIRECVLDSKLNPATPACDLQQACDTGIEAAVYIANKIALGQMEAGIAGGVDSSSDVPLLRFKDFTPSVPMNMEPHTGLSMGQHTEITAKYYSIPREEQDAMALESHQKMAAAYERGFFADMITPFMGLERDNNLRTDSSLEKLAKLKPAFDKTAGSLTAGNSSPLTDGASCVLLASEEWAKERGLPILAYITMAEIAAIEYIQNQHNLLMAPVNAADRMLRRAGLQLQDFDFYEIHEAFTAQVLATLKIWESAELSHSFGLEKPLGAIDRSKLNVNGSSIPAGHPFAATGGRIIATMAKLLNERGSGRGFISVCAAGGQGITMIMEK
ncbi:acetyl-CoA acetyltransferase [Russula earlei]|uniref:Acetyl-CoA acetyltransferase n=1 Tax=Russula earlei TaxID=71964 RepID=A0ACC0TT69_9AGAM|nr:acetyl-CoA acetyltransferase [Russula earlei]